MQYVIKYDSILDSLIDNVAVIDQAGTIQWVNKSWIDFSKANNGDPKKTLTGSNYLDACNVEDGQGISPISDGIRGVLAGHTSVFRFEYPCHSPDEDRWFVMLVTPLANQTEVTKFVVSHRLITDRKVAEISLQSTNDLLQMKIHELTYNRQLLEKQAAQLAELAESEAILKLN